MVKITALSCHNHKRQPGMTRWLFLRPAILALLLAAAACQSQPTAIPESTPTPVPTLAPTPTATVKPTATPEPTPTSTAAPTALNEPTSAPRPTPIPTLDPFPDASYWNVPADFYGEPVYGGTLRVSYEYPLEHANVWGTFEGPALRYRMPTMAQLVMEDPYDPYGPVIPDLAGDWEIHEGQDGVTFHFRGGATWHNGEPFVCEDARFSFETMMTGEGLTHPHMQSRLDNVVTEELSCLDDLTLRVHFTGPTATPLHAFANPFALVFNKAWFLEGDANAMSEGDLEYAMFADVSMGIGPFRWAEGQEVGVDEQHFERNHNYFIPGLPYVDELIIYGIVDDSARQAAHLAHQTDWVWVYDSLYRQSQAHLHHDDIMAAIRKAQWRGYWDQQYLAYVDHDQIVTVIRPGRSNFRLWINARNKPFDNVKVRQAIVMGIDRKSAILELQQGYGAVGGFGFAPGNPWELPVGQVCSVPGWCVSDDMEAVRAEARAILDAEGFDFDKTYWFTVESYLPQQARSAFLMEQLGLLGVKAEFEPPCYRRECAGWGDFLSQGNSVISDDPAATLGHYLRCDSLYNFWTPDGPCDESIEALLDQAQVETDSVKRLALAHEIELAAMRQYSSIPIYWKQEAAAFWPEVRGYVHFPHPSGSYLKFMHMWIDPAHGDDTGNSGQVLGVPGGR